MRLTISSAAPSPLSAGSKSSQMPSSAGENERRSTVRRLGWIPIMLLLALLAAGEIYVLTAGNSASDESGRLPLAESGILLVQRTLHSASVSSALPLLALIVAFGLGGLHALTPGHNKVLTGAYLVGSRAGYRDAVLIGGATAFSHTATVIVIGLLALSPQGQAAVSFYLRWLGVPAGLLVAGLGVWLLTRYLRGGGHPHSHAGGHDHSHGHSHEHAHSHHAPADRLTLGGLVGLGLMHGIVPTTDALAVLLVALSVKQTILGLLLILSYSLGIASVLSAVGVLFLTSQGLMQRFTRFATLSRWGPAIAAATVSLLGLAMIVRTIGV